MPRYVHQNVEITEDEARKLNKEHEEFYRKRGIAIRAIRPMQPSGQHAASAYGHALPLYVKKPEPGEE